MDRRMLLKAGMVAAGLVLATGASAQEVSEGDLLAKMRDAARAPSAAPPTNRAFGKTRSLQFENSADQPEAVVADRPGAVTAAPAPSQASAAASAGPGWVPVEEFHTIEFGLGSADIAMGSVPTLMVIARVMKNDQLADHAFLIVGHTDAIGSRNSNLALSKRRAASVVKFLATQGVNSSRLFSDGRGADQLLVPDDPTSGRNRRVQILISRGG